MLLDSATGRLDDLLHRICVELQLPEYLHDQAEERYHSIGKWLTDRNSPLAALTPAVYPQGSLAIGTTVRPLEGNEFDLDFVCEVATADWFRNDPCALLDAVEQRMLQHGTYSEMLSRKPRCIRVEYADEFHMDILPACPVAAAHPHAVLVPDSDLEDWSPSNPKGYCAWFEDRASLESWKLHEDMAPLGAYETAEVKAPLKRAVQLLKRWRDLEYKRSSEVAPISIVLTTLAGNAYGGEEYVADALQGALDGICRKLADVPAGSRLEVLNPANTAEDLSERWDENAEAYEAFCEGISRFRERWQTLRNAPLGEAAEILNHLFGEKYTSIALSEQTKRIEKLRADGLLSVKKSGVITASASTTSSPIKKNTFYGG